MQSAASVYIATRAGGGGEGGGQGGGAADSAAEADASEVHRCVGVTLECIGWLSKGCAKMCSAQSGLLQQALEIALGVLAHLPLRLQGRIAGASPGMLTYAHVCSRMRTYAHVCSRILTYADASPGMLTYADVC
jgi:hypothetical protein